MHPTAVDLDPTLHSPQISEIKRKLLARTIGQDHAVDKFVGILETFFTGYCNPNRPVGVVLELGPTGTGKTSLVETWSLRPVGQQKSSRAQARSHSQADPPPFCPSQLRTAPAEAWSQPAASLRLHPDIVLVLPSDLTGAEHHNRAGAVNRASLQPENCHSLLGRRAPSSRG